MPWTYSARIFRTSDGLWHFQVYRERQFDIQVLMLFTTARLIEAIETASTMQMHVDNILELPVSQYAIQSQYREGFYVTY